MRFALLLMTALATFASPDGAWAAKTPKACRRCRTSCKDAVSACLAATTCPAAPRRKNHKCVVQAKRRCRNTTTAECVASCKKTGSPVCATAKPAACVPYTSTCAAVPVTPAAVTSPFPDQLQYGFQAVTGSPGPGGCCVIDTCAGTTQFNTTAGGVLLDYHEVVYLDSQQLPTNGSIDTQATVTCAVRIPVNVYGMSDVYRVGFDVSPRFSLPPAPPAWTAPYVLTPGDLSISIDSANISRPSEANNSFTPSTWRLVNQTVGVDKVCAAQQSVEAHATASFVKNDGTSCSVTIYTHGTRTVTP